MIVDTSAIVSILKQEPDSRQLMTLLSSASSNRMSAGSHIELTVVIARSMTVDAFDKVDRLLQYFAVTIEPVTAQQTRLAREGFREFGQGSRHLAKLNFGDCFAYALAKETGEPLLFKGSDFGETDIEAAI